jgi:hypothetical protein
VKLIENLREWSTSGDEWGEYVKGADRFSDLPEGEERAVLGLRLAGLLDSYADRMDRSVLVRASTTYNSGVVRAEAAEYRAGRDPHV